MPFFLITLALLGLIIGSFLNAVIYRLHTGTKGLLTGGRSLCPQCRHTLHGRDLLPVVSYILLRGKCRYCHKRIGLQYPVVELMTAVVYVAIGWQVGMGSMVHLAWQLVIGAALVCIAVYDFLYHLIPDEISLPAIGLALLGSLFFGVPSIGSAAVGLALCGGFFLLLVAMSSGRWMGGGDIRIGALLGAWLGWELGLFAIFAASVLGSVVGLVLMALGKAGRKTEMPFGTYLAIGALISLVWGNEVIVWWMGVGV